MGDRHHDPTDHFRTTQPHAGFTMKDNLYWPGFILLAVSLSGMISTTAAAAYGHYEWLATTALVAVLGMIAGALWFAGGESPREPHRRAVARRRRRRQSAAEARYQQIADRDLERFAPVVLPVKGRHRAGDRRNAQAERHHHQRQQKPARAVPSPPRTVGLPDAVGAQERPSPPANRISGPPNASIVR